MLFTIQIFKNSKCFLDDQKTKLSICLKTSGQDFQTFNQKIGWDFEIFRGNQKLSLMFEKFGNVFGI